MSHHKLIRSLIAEVRQLRRDIQMAEANAEYETERAATALRSAKRSEYDRYEAEQAAASARYDRDQLADLNQRIEKAERLGKDWEADHLRREARRYY